MARPNRLTGGESSILDRALGRATPDADAAKLVLAFCLGRHRP